MKTFGVSFLLVIVIALVLELPGWWWGMPVAGLVGGWWIKHAGRGFLAGGLGVALAWAGFLIFFSVTSPLCALAGLFAGILGLGEGLGFVPVALALIIAFLMGGLGGLCGAMMRGLVNVHEPF